MLASAFTVFNFLTYGTTAVVARASGAGQSERAARLAAQALWVSLGIGFTLLVLGEAVAEPLLRGLGANGKSGEYALTYFRIAAVGLPAALVALAGQGYLRGVASMRRPDLDGSSGSECLRMDRAGACGTLRRRARCGAA